jgi:hypothetical protein
MLRALGPVLREAAEEARPFLDHHLRVHLQDLRAGLRQNSSLLETPLETPKQLLPVVPPDKRSATL